MDLTREQADLRRRSSAAERGNDGAGPYLHRNGGLVGKHKDGDEDGGEIWAHPPEGFAPEAGRKIGPVRTI